MVFVIILLIMIVAILLFGAAAVRGALGAILAFIAVVIGIVLFFIVPTIFIGSSLGVDPMIVFISACFLASGGIGIYQIVQHSRREGSPKIDQSQQYEFSRDDPAHDMKVRARYRRRMKRERREGQHRKKDK